MRRPQSDEEKQPQTHQSETEPRPADSASRHRHVKCKDGQNLLHQRAGRGEGKFMTPI